ncbi:hypothetical protein B0H14DRAFT_2561773 [Mycena olivaceomarginata]|nr:hypothetical protein B0H14DRAFT_2561773 [Mycena olivaceomarginata]
MKPIADAAFSLDNPHQQLFLPTKDDVANNSGGEDFSRPIPDAASCYALSLDNLHQRLLWVETAVLEWQLERDYRRTASRSGKTIPSSLDGGDLNDSTWLSGTALKVKGSIALAKWEKQKQLV